MDAGNKQKKRASVPWTSGRLAALAWGLVMVLLGVTGRRWRLLWVAGGGLLTYRGATGRNPLQAALVPDRDVDVRVSVTVDRPRSEVYAAWRPLEDLPRFMTHLSRVEVLGDGRSRWTARVPGTEEQVTWISCITSDQTDRYLAWHSEPGSEVLHEGCVDFLDAPGGRGTEVHVRLTFRPGAPGSNGGTLVAALLSSALERLLREDVRRFKRMVEVGEIVSVEGQPAGRSEPAPLASERAPAEPSQPHPYVRVYSHSTPEA